MVENISSQTLLMLFIVIIVLCIPHRKTQLIYYSEGDYYDLEERIVKLENGPNIIRYENKGQHRSMVAFTALLSKDTTVSGNAVVKYDHVLTNWGGAYQRSTGVFTAPYHGLYSISCSLMSRISDYANVKIVKNGEKMSQLYSAGDTFPHSGQTLQLLLNTGDKIWIENTYNREAELNDHASYNVFSGFLIAKL